MPRYKGHKEQNGLVMVQEPSSAKLTMPANAIRAVRADIIAQLKSYRLNLLTS
jgi:hypothetical protein